MPFCAAALIALFGRNRGALAVALSVGAAFVGMVAFLVFLQGWNGLPLTAEMEWFRLGTWTLYMGFYIDPMAALLLFVVTFVGFWIHLFSVGYMKDDSAKGRFFGGLAIFMFSMLGIVLSSNLFMLYIFWELVGFSSYMLIAHYTTLPEAAMASKKAFIVNRVGDFAFLLGIIWTYIHYGTANIADLKTAVHVEPSLVIAPVAFLLMGGFLGKSAQFPLHVWLPDAMAGPTPISALIHAATMVAAGIYFLCRMDFLFPTEVKTLILWLGAGMAVYAGFCALAQRDIKKILAYSTLSQLGYMAAAFGLGYPGLALFHLTCHAFFKALTFLSAGSVIAACHHEQDIFKMGGLYKKMPITTLTFGIGTAALCAVTFFSGFYSKDAIIEAAFLHNKAAYGMLLGAAFLTAIYMGRLYWVAFFGRPNSEKSAHAEENSWLMILPLVVLAVPSILGGFVKLWPVSLESVFAGEYEGIHMMIELQGADSLMFVLGAAAWVFGFLFTAFFYGMGAKEDRLENVCRPLYLLFKSKLWIDELYAFYVKCIQDRLAAFLAFFDWVVISGVIVRGVAGVVAITGVFFRSLHTGNLHGYVYWFLTALAFAGYWVFHSLELL